MKKTDFRRLYDKPQDVKFEKNPNKEDYRAIGRNFVPNPTANGFDKVVYYVIAVYPVLCTLSYFDKKKSIHISQRNIGIYAGIKSPTTVDQALSVLNGGGWIKRFKRTKDGRRLWYYKTNFIRADEQKKLSSADDYFIFRTWIVKSGLWAKLSIKAKYLYWGLLAFSKNDIWKDEVDRIDSQAIWYGPDGESYDLLDEDQFKEALSLRNWSDFNGSIKELCKRIGISHYEISKDLKQLEDAGLIEIVDKIDYRGLYLIKVF